MKEHGQSLIAGDALERITGLYAIKQTMRELDAAPHKALRQTKARLLLEDFKVSPR